MALNPAQVQAIPQAALDALAELESALKEKAAAALADPHTADAAALKSAFLEATQKAERGIEEAVVSSFSSAAQTAMLADEQLYSAARVAGLVAPYAPLAESATLTALLRDGVTTAVSMLNLVRTSAEQAVYAEFLNALDSALLGLATNVTDPTSAIRTAVKQIADMTPNVTYVTAAGDTITRSIYAATREAVLTGAHQTTLRMAEARAKEIGAEYVEITAHSGARPEHAEWQGQVIKLSDLEEVTGYGSGEGLGGWNCAHSFYPFFPGIMEPLGAEALPDPDDVEEDYALSQRQRECERNIRAYQTKANTYRAAGLDSEARHNRELATKWRKEADSVAAKRGGARRRDRETANAGMTVR